MIDDPSRRPITGDPPSSPADVSADVETLPDGSVAIPLLEEEVVVGKRRVVRERIVVRKRFETVEERVEREVGREELELDADETLAVEGDVVRGVATETAPGGTARGLLTVDDVPMLRDVPVITLDEHELGRIGDIEYDESSRRIYAVGVAADALGFRRRLIPVEGATLREDGLHVPFTSEELERVLAEDEEQEEEEVAADVEVEPASAPERPELVRHEEELQLGKRIRELGVVRARKRVERQRVERVVPRTIEHYEEVERVPAAPDDSGEIQVLPDGSVSIPLIEEEVVVGTQTKIRERVLIRKQGESDRYRIEARLRRERVEVETDEEERAEP